MLLGNVTPQAPGLNDSIDSFEKAADEFDKSLASNSVNNPGLLVGFDGHESNEFSESVHVNNSAEDAIEEEEEAIPDESRISKALSEQIQKIVVMMVLIMLFMLPLTQIETYISPYLFAQAGLKIAVDEYNKGDSWSAYQTAI